MTWTRRLGGGYFAATGEHVLYRGAPGETTVVRDICLHSYSPDVGDLRVQIQPSGGGAMTLVELEFEPGQAYHLDLRQELLVDEYLVFWALVAPATVVVTGYRFID